MADDLATNQWSNPHKGDVFQRVAKIAGLTPAEWQAIEHRLPAGFERMRLLLELLQRSARSDTVLFCLDDIVVLRHEGHISTRVSAMHTLHTRERIRGKNEVVDPSARLSAEELRSICVTLEALVYKIVHITMEQQSASYSERSQTYEARLSRLTDAKQLGPADRDLAIEIYKTRNQFAHSLLHVEEITYRMEPLSDRWGARGVSGQRKFKRYFLPDVFEFSEALLKLFRPIQSQQLDPGSFRAALDDLLEVRDDVEGRGEH